VPTTISGHNALRLQRLDHADVGKAARGAAAQGEADLDRRADFGLLAPGRHRVSVRVDSRMLMATGRTRTASPIRWA
jgi:hypothetical protein